MDYKRFIKLLLPSNQFIKVQISKDENKVREMLSKITNISPSQIKGIKDLKGNYYTLSSFIKNNNYNSDSDIYYELILGRNSIKEKDINSTDNNKEFNICQNQNNFFNIPQFSNNYFIDDVIHKRAASMNELSSIEIQKFSSYLLQFLSSKEINESQYFELNKMMNEKNKELITQFKFFLNGKITNENFILLLKLFHENRTKHYLINQKDKINKDSLSNQEIFEKINEFFSPIDKRILNQIINEEKCTIEIQKYKLGGNLSNLIKFFQKEINKHKIPKKAESSIVLKKKYNLNDDDKKNKFIRMNSTPNNNVDDFMDLNQYEKKLVRIKKLLNKSYQNLIQLFYENDNKEFNNVLKICNEEKKLKGNLTKCLNDFCKEFLDKKIINYTNKKNIDFPETKFKLLHEIIDANNPLIIIAFQKLLKNKSYKSLIKELISIINYINLNEKKENKDLLMENFIENLENLSLLSYEKERIKDLIKSKDEQMFEVIELYNKNNRNINLVNQEIKTLLKKKISNTLSICQLKVKDSMETIYCPKINERKKFIDLNYDSEKKLEEFKKVINQNFQNEENAFLIEKFTQKNPILISLFDVYLKEWNLNELINSIIIFLKNEFKTFDTPINKRNNNNNNVSTFSNEVKQFKTPEALKDTKDKLSLFINSSTNRTQSVIIKQKEIISILYQEQCISKDTYNIIYKKIEGDEGGLIAAFEVYAVTKDHNEFIETLNIIAEAYKSYKIPFIQLLNASKFDHFEKEDLITLHKKKDKKLFKILYDYEIHKDITYSLDLMKDLIEG